MGTADTVQLHDNVPGNRALEYEYGALAPVEEAFAIAVIRARRDHLEHLAKNGRAIGLDPDVGRKTPHRKIGLQRIDVDLDPVDGFGTKARALQGTRHGFE